MASLILSMNFQSSLKNAKYFYMYPNIDLNEMLAITNRKWGNGVAVGRILLFQGTVPELSLSLMDQSSLFWSCYCLPTASPSESWTSKLEESKNKYTLKPRYLIKNLQWSNIFKLWAWEKTFLILNHLHRTQDIAKEN